MHLFRCGNAKPAGVPAPTTLNTPLGAVRFDAVLDGENMADEAPTRMHQLVAGGRLVCWHRQEFDLELLVCRPVPSRSSQKGLTDCWAGLWRLRVQTTIASCTFTAVWEEGYTWLGRGPDTGQGLYAKTWEDGQTEVSIGTEDEQALATRSHQRDRLPAGWEKYFRSPSGLPDWFSLQDVHRELGDRGLAVPLPPLEAGE